MLATKFAAFHEHQQTHGCCPLCQMIGELSTDDRYVIFRNEDWLAFSPPASRVPYEICLLPIRHQGRFEQLADATCHGLAGLLQDILGRLEQRLPHVAYNFWIHTAAFDGRDGDDYHWHVEITPRLTTQAGFEWGSGCWINPIPPEQAAEQLRLLEDDRVC